MYIQMCVPMHIRENTLTQVLVTGDITTDPTDIEKVVDQSTNPTIYMKRRNTFTDTTTKGHWRGNHLNSPMSIKNSLLPL